MTLSSLGFKEVLAMTSSSVKVQILRLLVAKTTMTSPYKAINLPSLLHIPPTLVSSSVRQHPVQLMSTVRPAVTVAIHRATALTRKRLVVARLSVLTAPQLMLNSASAKKARSPFMPQRMVAMATSAQGLSSATSGMKVIVKTAAGKLLMKQQAKSL